MRFTICVVPVAGKRLSNNNNNEVVVNCLFCHHFLFKMGTGDHGVSGDSAVVRVVQTPSRGGIASAGTRGTTEPRSATSRALERTPGHAPTGCPKSAPVVSIETDDPVYLKRNAFVSIEDETTRAGRPYAGVLSGLFNWLKASIIILT